MTDTAWMFIPPLPPKPGIPRGGRDRQIIRTMWKLQTGALWRDMAERYGSDPLPTPASSWKATSKASPYRVLGTVPELTEFLRDIERTQSGRSQVGVVG
ncbi:transposase [Micromonospora echinospora]|uniref:transposase n=1 Tax=Micromonospora echinospora TaxID=1877 RepID=UPI001180558C|nr:transposase [Micromonospora echinospora]